MISPNLTYHLSLTVRLTRFVWATTTDYQSVTSVTFLFILLLLHFVFLISFMLLQLTRTLSQFLNFVLTMHVSLNSFQIIFWSRTSRRGCSSSANLFVMASINFLHHDFQPLLLLQLVNVFLSINGTKRLGNPSLDLVSCIVHKSCCPLFPLVSCLHVPIAHQLNLINFLFQKAPLGL